MSKELTIFGAGLSGLIAARMLADRKPIVREKQSSLPNNHHALLRFRSPVVGEVTNCPFKKVRVSKIVLAEQGSNPIKDASIYSLKVTGKLHSRSILDLSPAERYIAPQDFISRLASTCTIEYNSDFQDWCHNLVRPHGPIISTLPVGLAMGLFRWKDVPDFHSKPGWTVKAEILPELESQLNATIYSALRNNIWYRASVTDSSVMVEGAGDPPTKRYAEIALGQALDQFGIALEQVGKVSVHCSKYQKIADLDTAGRESVKRFVMWLSDEHQIYSLGRFATWRPKLLLDDIVNDVRVIARLIDGESLYNSNLNK